MPARVIVTADLVADCTQAGGLVEGTGAENLIADRGYDTDAAVEMTREAGMVPVIPPKSNRKDKRRYDEHLYRLRHLVENAFAEMKQWRGIATRYAKNAASYLAAVHFRCIIMRAKIY
jgi:transposase